MVLWVLCLVIIAILLRLAFGDLIDRLRISVKQNLRHRAKQKLAERWCKKWLELSSLIQELGKCNWQPTEEQRNTYSELHSWFISNRIRLLPAWKSFYINRIDAAYERQLGSSASLKYKVLTGYEDPFSYFYEPFLIEEFQEHFKYQSESDIAEVLIKLRELNKEFVQWVSLR